VETPRALITDCRPQAAGYIFSKPEFWDKIIFKGAFMKNLVSFFSIAAIAFAVFSCSTAGTVWDDSVPLEQSAKIVFVYFEPTSYNRIIVDKKEFKIVTIPAGAAEFEGDVAWFDYGANVRYDFRVEDAVFSCKLEGGKEYWACVSYKYNEEAKNRIWGISLYNDEIKNRIGFPGDDKLVGFIPFNPPVISN
jgi:hypothetical protein